MIDTTLTLYNAIQRCLSEINLSKYTKNNYTSTLLCFAREYIKADETTLMVDVDFDRFINYPAWLATRGMKVASIRASIAAVKYFIRWLSIPEFIIISQSQMDRFEQAIKQVTSKHERHLPNIPKTDTVNEMIQAAETSNEREPERSRTIAMILTLAHSGLRIGEMVTLKVEDIDFNLGEIYVKGGKGDADRVAYASSEALTSIRNYWTKRGFSSPTDPAFARHDRKVSTGRKPLSTIAARYALKKVGAINPHAFRHWFATTMLEETSDITMVQKSLGHAQVATTLIYAEVRDQRVKSAHKKVFG